MSASIALNLTPDVRYVLRIADTCLIHAQRLSEWCGHAPVLEEDIALANLGLDLLGQARALLTHAAALEGSGHDEDALAFLRDEREFFNLTLVEMPLRRGGADFADTQLRCLIVAAWLLPLWRGLQASRDAALAAIAGKASKETRYHLAHAADWVVRLGDGNEESRRRMTAALARAWPHVAELFDDDAVDEAADASGLGPRASALREAWLAALRPVFADARLALPADAAFRSHGRRGVHSEHMGYVLAEMQHLQRAFPGGVW
ncbi:MAG: 1,2-phenylacetyl-CoA epoxidase subunit PaaC [Pseudomonadota bacterium]